MLTNQLLPNLKKIECFFFVFFTWRKLDCVDRVLVSEQVEDRPGLQQVEDDQALVLRSGHQVAATRVERDLNKIIIIVFST